ncbi:MAG: transposase, partial [Clostridium sp.]
HDVKGFNYLFEQIKKVEEEFNTKTAIFMESTGVYHLSLFHFLNKNFDNIFVINPLVTNCNKNGDIRKVKNDKKDSLAIAKIGKYRNKVPINKILLEYYQTNLKGKKAKVALVAIMHKILNFIFAFLRNQTPFEQRDPKLHKQMFL